MKDEIMAIAKDIADKTADLLKEDKHFGEASFDWYGGDYIEFYLCIKEIPNYRYVCKNVPFKDLEKDIPNMLVEKWNKEVTEDGITGVKNFIDYVRGFTS